MNSLHVYFHGLEKSEPLKLGRLAYKDGRAFLEMAQEFLSLGLNISPVNLRETTALQEAPRAHFEGLHGVFADSLPDGWGLLLMDRNFRQENIPMDTITPLYRLAYIGDRAMGALSYHPSTSEEAVNHETISLSKLSEASLRVYEGETKEILKTLYQVGGSPGGARPKATIGLNDKNAIAGARDLPEGYQHWLVKFPTGRTLEQQAEGIVEYIYSIMARAAGINFPQTMLFESDSEYGFFGCRRFDRGEHNQRYHMHTLAGLINADFRLPDCDYQILIKATAKVTKSNSDMREVVRRMIFNILSGNRDDHTKNFSFLMNGKGQWSLSPAYDVTFNSGINGHHSMAIAGEACNVSREAIQKVASLIPLKKKEVDELIDEVASSLSQWRSIAKTYPVPDDLIDQIDEYFNQQIKNISG